MWLVSKIIIVVWCRVSDIITHSPKPHKLKFLTQFLKLFGCYKYLILAWLIEHLILEFISIIPLSLCLVWVFSTLLNYIMILSNRRWELSDKDLKYKDFLLSLEIEKVIIKEFDFHWLESRSLVEADSIEDRWIKNGHTLRKSFQYKSVCHSFSNLCILFMITYLLIIIHYTYISYSYLIIYYHIFIFFSWLKIKVN